MENMDKESQKDSATVTEQQVIITPSEASIRRMQSAATVKSSSSWCPHPDNTKQVEHWRELSRYVSFGDMVFTFAAFIQAVVLVAGAIYGLVLLDQQEDESHISQRVFDAFNSDRPFPGFPQEAENLEEKYESAKAKQKGIVIAALVLFLILLFSHIVGFWMAYKLYCATNPLTLQQESIQKARHWRMFYIFKILFHIFIGVITSLHGPTFGSLSFLWFLLACGFLYVVHKYITEMQKNSEAGEMTRKSAASVRPVMTVTEAVDGSAPSSAKSKA